MTMTKPSELPKQYYSFKEYNSKHRLITYWHQIEEVLALKPTSILEIGVGTGLVTSYLRSLNIDVTTVDINDSLSPDHVGSVLELDKLFDAGSYDVVLCARVLHHIPYESVELAFEQISRVARKGAVITLPVNDCRIYLTTRFTSSNFRTFSIPFPLALKKMLVGMLSRKREKGERFISGLWKINSSADTKMDAVLSSVKKAFAIKTTYPVPEDRAHQVFVLEPNGGPDG